MKIIRFTFSAILFLLFMLTISRKAEAATDTTFVLSLEINMTKAVRTGIFDPSLDRLYAVFDLPLGEQQLVPKGDNKFTLLLPDGVDSGQVYNFRFRINNFITETVSRQVTIKQGVNYYYCWWNNDYLNYTWLQVDMSYMVQQHVFRPDTDFVDVVGSMNLYQGSAPLSRIGSSYVYQIMYNIDPGMNAAFKFRINGDTSKTELKGKPNRFILAPDSVIHQKYWFNDYNPSTVPMTFYCNMKFMTKKGYFSRQYDHVDVAGSFNNQGAYDILYDYDKDSIYTATLLIDTAFLQQNPITFKYRINSSWQTAELQNQPARSHVLIDTSGGFRNIDSSWYNNWNPYLPSPPIAYNVNIQGRYIYKQVVTGAYSFLSVNGYPERGSTYQWYVSQDSLGTSATPIDTATNITYTIDTTCIHNWLIFEVTPIADSGSPAIGVPVRVITQTRVGYTGIDEKENMVISIRPNPFSDHFLLESRTEVSGIRIYDLTGRMVFSTSASGTRNCELSPPLQPGVYLMKVTDRQGGQGWARIVRL